MQINATEIKDEILESLNNGKAKAIEELIEDYPDLVSIIPNTMLDAILEYGFRHGFAAGMKFVSGKI